MRTKRRISIRFEYLWSDILHLADGSEWRLADPASRHDVLWWQSGEEVELDRNRSRTLLHNLDRDETVPLERTGVGELKLAA